PLNTCPRLLSDILALLPLLPLGSAQIFPPSIPVFPDILSPIPCLLCISLPTLLSAQVPVPRPICTSAYSRSASLSVSSFSVLLPKHCILNSTTAPPLART